jgi:hypothetical protein
MVRQNWPKCRSAYRIKQQTKRHIRTSFLVGTSSKQESPVSLHVALAKRLQASTSILGYSQNRSQARKIAQQTEA